MRRVLVLALGLVLLIVAPAQAGKPDPTGSFTLSPGPYVEGGIITFTVTPIRNATKNDEHTLGVWCARPDGTYLQWGNRGSTTHYEFNAFGDFTWPLVLYLPVEGTGYSCTAQLVVVDWFKGTPIRAWTLDTHYFTVEA